MHQRWACQLTGTRLVVECPELGLLLLELALLPCLLLSPLYHLLKAVMWQAVDVADGLIHELLFDLVHLLPLASTAVHPRDKHILRALSTTPTCTPHTLVVTDSQ